MEIIVFAFLILIYIVVFLIEHKQKMEHLEFQQRLYKLRQEFLDAQRNDESSADDKKERDV